MKKLTLLVLIIWILIGVQTFALSLEDVTEAENGISENAAINIGKVNENFSFYDTVKSISEGKYSADLKGVLSKTLDMLFSEIRTNIKIMGAVILLGILYSFISNLSSSFGNGGVSEAAFLCCYATLAGITAGGFYEISECARAAVSDMGLFIKSLIPVLTTLSAAEGRVITASVLHTEILAATAISSFVIEKAVMPLLFASFALKFINNITKTLSLASLSKMADKMCRRILSFMLLIFTAMLTLSGFAAGTAENMGMKTARFALSSFVPVAGGALADTVSAITASAGMIKSSAGIAGIIAIILIAAYPVIKCAAVSFVYNFTGAVLEPVCDSRLVTAISSVGECMGMLFGIVSVTAAQYIISAAILITVYRG